MEETTTAIVYIWLAEQGVSEKEIRDILFSHTGAGNALFPVKVELKLRDEERRHIRVNGDILDPSFAIPEELNKFITGVTMKTHIRPGLRRLGRYRLGDAVLLTDEEVSQGREPCIRQYVSVRAPSLESLRNLYSCFRQGTIVPDKGEDWGWPQVEPSKSEPK